MRTKAVVVGGQRRLSALPAAGKSLDFTRYWQRHLADSRISLHLAASENLVRDPRIHPTSSMAPAVLVDGGAEAFRHPWRVVFFGRHIACRAWRASAPALTGAIAEPRELLMGLADPACVVAALADDCHATRRGSGSCIGRPPASIEKNSRSGRSFRSRPGPDTRRKSSGRPAAIEGWGRMTQTPLGTRKT